MRMRILCHSVNFFLFGDLPGEAFGHRKVAAPKGRQDSAQGFNPGNRHPERRALKGRQIERTNNVKASSNCVPRLNCASHSRRNRCEIYLVGLSPLQGELVYFEGSQG
jgi:hypothetical protein